nr:hypothetical protein [Tanacetum cinerariifolium]
MYREYLAEFWYSAQALENSKVSFLILTGKISGVVGVNSFRNSIGAHYLPHSSEYLAPPSIDMKEEYGIDEVTLYPTQVFNVDDWALKPNKPERPPFTAHMLAICNTAKPVVFKSPKISSKAKNTELHKEDHQATGGPTSLEVTNEERANPQLSSSMSALNLNEPIFSASFIIHSESVSGHDVLADSIDKVDPGLSAPNDSIPPRQDDHVIIVDESDKDEPNAKTEDTLVPSSSSPKSS